MNYTIRDKSGKNLGSFPASTLVQMLKEKRLTGEEEVLSPTERAWKPLSSVKELLPHLPQGAAASGALPLSSLSAPVDLSGLFSDIQEGAQTTQDAPPDFTLSPTVVQPARPPPSPPRPMELEKTVMAPPPVAPAPPPAPPLKSIALEVPQGDLGGEEGGSLESLWVDDHGKPLDTSAPAPATPPSDILESIPKANPQPAEEAIQFPDLAPAGAGGIPKEGLEDLFSAPGAPPPGTPPPAGDSLDSLLGATPDLFASDLVMPETLSAAPPSPPSATPPPSAPVTAKPKSKGRAPTPAAEKTSAKSAKPAARTTSFLQDFIEKVKEAVEERLKTLLISAGAIVLLVAGALIYLFLFAKPKAIPTPSLPSATSDSAESGSPSGAVPGISLETAQAALIRDNFGSYMEAASGFENLLLAVQDGDEKKVPILAGAVEALSRAQLRYPPDPNLQSKVEALSSQLSNAPRTPEVLRALAGGRLAKRQYQEGREFLNQALATSPDETNALDLMGYSYLLEGNSEQAEQAFSASLKGNPANLRALYELALLRARKTGANQEYISQLRRILDLAPQGLHVASRLLLATYAYQNANFDEALKHLQVVTAGQAKESHRTEITQALYLQGLSLMAQGKDAEAQESFIRSIGIDPTHAPSLYELGKSFLRAGKIEEAKSRILSAMQGDPQNATYKMGFAMALHAEKKFGDALLYLDQAQKLDPQNPEIYLQLGLLKKSMNEFEEAISYLRKSQNLGKKGVEATLTLAAIFREQKKLNLALTEYRTAVALVPNQPEIHAEIGSILLDLGQYAGAQQELQLAIKYTPDEMARSLLYFKLGKAFQGDGKFADAITSFQTAKKLNPQYVEAGLALGIAYFQNKAPDQSIDTLEGLRESFPEGDHLVHLYFHLANAYLEQGNDEKSLALYEKVLGINPEYPKIHIQIGDLYLRKNLHQKAIEEYRLALPKLDVTDQYRVYLNIANGYTALGEIEKAFQIYETLRKRFPKEVEPYIRIGLFYEEQQQVQNAIPFYRKAVDLEPKNARAHYHLGFAYKAIRQPAYALKHFQMALRLNPQSENASQIREEIELLRSGR